MRVPSPGTDVVVSGVSVITAVGVGTERLWDALRNNRSCFGAVEVSLEPLADTALLWGGAITEPLPGARRRETRSFHREAMLLSAACELGIGACGDLEVPQDRLGICVAVGEAGQNEFLATLATSLTWGAGLVSPVQGVNSIYNSASARTSILLAQRGPNLTVAGGAASGVLAVRHAARMLRRGEADVLVASGVDVIPYDPRPAAAADRRPAPLDRGRSGSVPGEAAVVLILETRGRAEARSAPVLATVGAGYAGFVAPDAGDDPVIEGHAAELRRVIGRSAGPLGGVVTSASGDLLNDALVARALARALGAESASLPVCAPKGALGDGAGAGALLAAAVAVLAVGHRELPPTAGFQTPDPELPPLQVTREPHPLAHARVLVHALGPTGQGAAVVIEGEP